MEGRGQQGILRRAWYISVTSEKVTMTSLIHESTRKKENAVIKYIYKTKGYIPEARQVDRP